MRLFSLRLFALLLLGLLRYSALPARAQAPAFGTVMAVGNVVAAGAGGNASVQVGNTASDAQGNIYLTGSFMGTVAFGSITLSSPNASDIFVAKLSGTGAYLWAVQAGGPSADGGASVAVDAQGSVCVTGSYIGPATFGGLTLAGMVPGLAGFSDAFVGRLDGAGNWLWVRGGGGNQSDNAGPVVLDAAGNAYISATFSGATAQFGPFSVANVDPLVSNVSDFVIAKLDPAGNWRWVRSAGSSGYDWARTLALDGSGHLFAYGSFEGYTLALGGLNITNSGSGSNDVYIAQLDTAGTWRWARDAGGTFIDLDGGMALDGANNAYIAGTFRSTSMGFGALSLPSHSGTNQIGELFVAKIDGAGNWLWATASGSARVGVGGMAVGAAGEAMLTGSFSGSTAQFGSTILPNSSAYDANRQAYGADAFLARLGPTGAWLGASSSQGLGNEAGQGVWFNAAGDLLTTGTFQGTSATFGAITLANNGSTPTNYLGFVPGALALARVTGLVPSSGAPGQTVTVTGSGFVGVTGVLFNGTAAASFAVQSATQLTAVVPAGVTAGPVSVRTAAGTGSSTTAFTPAALASAAAHVHRLTLSPNPTANYFLVVGPASGSAVQLFDVMGRVARETTVSAQGEVSIRGLAPGFYRLRTTDQDGLHYTGCVVVE